MQLEVKFRQNEPNVVRVSTIIRIQEALERAGVRFTEDEGGVFGVRLDKKPQRR